MKLKKAQREALFEKFGGKCAYCGCELQKGFHADHVEPIYRGWEEHHFHSGKIKRGKDDVENLVPACPRCNRWKLTWTVEQFRNEISMQIERLIRDSAQFRLAMDFGIIKETQTPVKFFFETYNQENQDYCLCDFVTTVKDPTTLQPKCYTCKKPIKV